MAMQEDEAPTWLTGGGGDPGGTAAPHPSSPPPDAPPSFSLVSPDDGNGGGAGGGGASGGGGGVPSPPSGSDAADASAAGRMLDASGAADPLAQDEKDLPGVILVMRLANMGVSIVLVACSVVTMMTFPVPATWVLAVYASCGGLLICCLETQLKFLRVMIAMNFGFLFSSIFRFMFYLILGSVAWAYNSLFGMITGILLVTVAVFNAYVLIRYPSYRRVRDKIAEEEDRRIEARISREVKKQAVKSFARSG